jgi:predicted ATPase
LVSGRGRIGGDCANPRDLIETSALPITTSAANKSGKMCLKNLNLFVISGGPGAGKTTVLLELEKLGFQYAPEVARQIIQEQVRSGGAALPWSDRQAYTDLMLERSIESFKKHTPAAKPLFADRGIPDTLCYARFIGIGETSSIERACREYQYASLVFLAPPWKEIYHTDSERKQEFEEAERTYHSMAEVYRECGYQTIELPKLTAAARARFILDQVQLLGHRQL